MQSQRIILTQKQQLKLSPQMYQSLELLALPIQDLQARIQDEIERNPALELSDAKDLSYESYTGSSETHTYDYFENSSDAGYIRKASHIDTDSKHQFMEAPSIVPNHCRSICSSSSGCSRSLKPTVNWEH